jgi:hypothetical protein
MRVFGACCPTRARSRVDLVMVPKQRIRTSNALTSNALTPTQAPTRNAKALLLGLLTLSLSLVACAEPGSSIFN